MSVAASGDDRIDSLLAYRSWSGTTGVGVTVGYAFDVPTTTFSDGRISITGVAVPAAMQVAYVNAMNAWSNVANITFSNVGYQYSSLDFFKADLAPLSSGTLGVTLSYDFGGGAALDYEVVALDDRYNSAASVAVGSTGYFAIMHEIGHALGFEHPGSYGQGEQPPYLPSGQDNIQNTIMSYYNGTIVTQSGNPPSTPMVYDIAAMQYLYGANHNYRAGDDYYTYNGGYTTQTIWDGNGQDVISAYNYTNGVLIDLREGENYHSTIGNSLVWIAYGANIEDAGGGKAADIMFGNNLGNLLVGWAGNDTLYGFDSGDTLVGDYGNDYLVGGEGNDTLSGEFDNDYMQGDNGNDFFVGWTGNDTIYGGTGTDAIYTNDDSDLAYGGDDSDSLYGSFGDDTLYGDGGNDLVMGHEGNDVMYGDSAADANPDGNDTMYGLEGNDSMYGGGGTLDELFGGIGNDYLSGGTGVDGLAGEAGNDTILGGAGNDILNGGANNDTLTGGTGDDTFMFNAGFGLDTITDFEGEGAAGGDRIYLIGTGASSFSDLVINYAGGSATIDLGGGNIITIGSVSTPFIAGDFLFG